MSEPVIGGIYQHFKGGVYQVTDIEDTTVHYQRILDEELNADSIHGLTRALEGEDGWNTPKNLDGKLVPRFQRI